MKLTKDQIAEVVETLSQPYGYVKLVCDGYRVTLSAERAKGMTYRVMTYVNGRFIWEWMLPKNAAPESRFLRKSEIAVCSKSDVAKAEKLWGKRHVKQDPYYSKKITFYERDWASGKAALSHLCKVCESIQIDQ